MDKHQHIIKSEEDMEEERDQYISGSGNDKKKRSSNCSVKRGSMSTTSIVTAGGGSMRCCQAERCSADLNDAKQYHKRHKVCEFHAKAQVVLVAGVGQRFCQQCSRFHELSEFDEAKRSCRRRLAGHNERRRKSSSDSHGEASGSSSSRKGSSGSKENGCGKADHDRGRNQITSMQENATAFKNFEIR